MSSARRIGVLLLQLGTPDDPSTPAVRRYLEEFLLDERVIDLPRVMWKAVLYLSVLRKRPAESGRLYRKIWTSDGSPLLVISRQQAAALEHGLTETENGPVRVEVAMRYGQPSIASATARLVDAGCDRLLAFPMYPQYSSASTGSSLELLFRQLAPRRVVPSLRVVPPYYDDPAYIRALAAGARDTFTDWVPDHVLLSFHGYPKRYVELGDPYRAHCEGTSRALSAEMGWTADRMTMSYQSLFGKEEWLRPYTNDTLRALATRGFERLGVLCPGFTADCLETLEEMGMTNREVYEQAGGGGYRLVPCLNVHPAWVEAMTAIAIRELSGWMAGNDDGRRPRR